LAKRDARAADLRVKPVQGFNPEGFAHLVIEPPHLFHLLRVRYEVGVYFFAALVNSGDHQHHEFHGISPFLIWFCIYSRLGAAEFDSSRNLFSKKRFSGPCCVKLKAL
jgi:hypothetical protein